MKLEAASRVPRESDQLDVICAFSTGFCECTPAISGEEEAQVLFSTGHLRGFGSTHLG